MNLELHHTMQFYISNDTTYSTYKVSLLFKDYSKFKAALTVNTSSKKSSKSKSQDKKNVSSFKRTEIMVWCSTETFSVIQISILRQRLVLCYIRFIKPIWVIQLRTQNGTSKTAFISFDLHVHL